MTNQNQLKARKTMRNTPIERKLIDETIEAFQIADFGKATIREVKAIAAKAEAESGIEFIKMDAGYGSRDLMTIMIDGKRMSKNLMVQKLSEMPNAIYITRDKIALGMLGDALGIPRVSGGGYFGFWVKENKVKKYIDVDVEDLDERFSKI